MTINGLDSSPPRGFDPGVVLPPPLIDKSRRLMSLALDVSGSCNLKCRYCAESATQPRRRRMSPEVVDAAWRLLCPDGEIPRGASLRFGSGEPLLGLTALQRVWKLSRPALETKSHQRLAVFLTTNGTLITPRIMEWLADSGWHVKISLDGPKSVHDAWRVRSNGGGTFETVAVNISALARAMPERLSATAVLCHGSDPKVVFGAIADLGVKRIELVPVASRDPSIQVDRHDVARYFAFVKDYVRRYVRESRHLPTLVRLADRVTGVMGYNNLQVPCGAGRTFLGVGPEGDLYPCFRFIGIARYRLGHVTVGLDIRAAEAFWQTSGRGYERREQCSACWAAPLCGGPCFACAEMFGPGNGEPIAIHCAYTRADARAAVWLVEKLKKENPARLLSFIPGGISIE